MTLISFRYWHSLRARGTDETKAGFDRAIMFHPRVRGGLLMI